MIITEPRAILTGFLTESLQIRIGEDDTRCIGWTNGNSELTWLVGYTGFTGKVCMMHVVHCGPAEKAVYMPKIMLRAAYEYPFKQLGLKEVLGTIDSSNERSLNLSRWAGWEELYRIKGGSVDGGDLILLHLTREKCRFLKDFVPEEPAPTEKKRMH